MAENKETIILDFQVEQGDAISELEKTKISILNLKKEQQELNKAYKANQISIEEFASESVRLEGIFKKQTNQYNTVQKSVTGVKTQFDKLIETNKGIQKSLENSAAQLSDIAGGLASVVPGLGGFKKAQEGVNLALKANPIGAVITLLLALKEIFSGNSEVADKLSFILTGLNKGFQFIIDTIVTTVTSFDNLKKAITSPLQFIQDLAKGTVEAGKAGFEAAQAQDGLALALAKSNRVIKENEVSIQSLEKTLKDRTKTEKERIAIANQLADLEEKNAAEREKIAQRNLKVEEDLLKGKTLSGEEEAKLENLRTEVFAAQSETRIIQAEREQRINKLLAAETKEVNKEVANEIKQRQKEEDEALIKREEQARNLLVLRQQEIDKLKEYISTLNQREAEQQKLVDSIINSIEVEKEQSDVLDEESQNSIDRARQRLAFEKLTANQRLEIAKQGFAAAQAFAEQGSSFQKALALSTIAVDTAQAISGLTRNSEANPANAVTFGAAGALQFALGLIRILGNIAQAKSLVTAAAGGGKFLTKGPQLLLVGDNPGGVERVTVEPISGRGKTVVGDGMIRLAGGGVVETQSATSGTRSNFAFANSFKNLPPIYTSITELREKTNKVQFKENLVTV